VNWKGKFNKRYLLCGSCWTYWQGKSSKGLKSTVKSGNIVRFSTKNNFFLKKSVSWQSFFKSFQACLNSWSICWQGLFMAFTNIKPPKKNFFCANDDTRTSCNIIILLTHTVKNWSILQSGCKVSLLCCKKIILRSNLNYSFLIQAWRPILGLHMPIFQTLFSSAFS
jgi:hypothetical protein